MTTAQFTTRKTFLLRHRPPRKTPSFHSYLACAPIVQPDYSFGRPSLPLADMAYAATMKVYTGFSARRFNCDVQEANRQGFTQTAPVVGEPVHRRPRSDSYPHGFN